MKLYGNAASPFVRKALIIAHELGIKLEVVKTIPAGNEEFRRINPLGKVPALVLDDGSVLIDSPVICEYLNQYGGGKFFPGMSLWAQRNRALESAGAAGAGRRHHGRGGGADAGKPPARPQRSVDGQKHGGGRGKP